MSEHAKIEKDGIWSYKWDGDAREYVKRRPRYIWTLLRCSCEIEEGVTLRDIFEGVAKLPDLKDFISQYAWCRHIDEFHEDARKMVLKMEPDPEPLDHLEIYWHASTHNYKKKNSIDLSAGFHGIGKPNEQGFTCYSVSYSPMWELANLPVKLNTEVSIYDPKMRDGKAKLIFMGERDFTLLDVLDAIYDDISFMGGPADNAAFLEEMKETTEKIKSGELETVPWEDLGLDEDEDEETFDPSNN
jgi:hypothetical protein